MIALEFFLTSNEHTHTHTEGEGERERAPSSVKLFQFNLVKIGFFLIKIN